MAGELRLGLAEQVEDVFDIVGRQANAIVDDVQSRALVGLTEHHADLRIVRTEFQCVVQKVPHHLLQASRVGFNDKGGDVCGDFEGDAGIRVLLAGYPVHVLEHRDQVQRAHLQLQLARADTCDIQQVIDDAGLAGHRIANGCDHLAQVFDFLHRR
ncbi:hypothetical protein D3C73_1053690 [compost metagenome]